MFASVNSMSDELKTLSSQLEGYGTEATEKMDAIAAKFEEIVGLALEIVGQTLNPDTDDILSDTSDADVDAITLGKLYGCANTGAVEGLFQEGDSLVCQPVIADQFPEVAQTWQDVLGSSFLDGVVYQEVVEQWKLTIPEDDAQSHIIRYLQPEKSGNLSVYVKDGNAWERVEAEQRGNYLYFSVEKHDVMFAVLSYTNAWWVWLIPVALIGVTTACIVGIVRAAKKKKPIPTEEENE